MLDHFPGLPEYPLFDSYNALFQALSAWMPRAITPDRVGMREIQPGVWAGCHSHVSHEAQLIAPCWVGNKVLVGARAVIGPNAIVEDGALIEPGAVITQSQVGPHTFVGSLDQIRHSLAWGATLINWKTGSLMEVPDPLVLSSLRPEKEARPSQLLSRLSELWSHENDEKEEGQLLWKHIFTHHGMDFAGLEFELHVIEG